MGGNGCVMSIYLVIRAWQKPCVGGPKSINSGGDPALWVIKDPLGQAQRPWLRVSAKVEPNCYASSVCLKHPHVKPNFT